MADYSIYEDSSSSWKDKYEGAIRDLQKDLQDTVLLAQSYAETNAEASRDMISLLTEQISQKDAEIDELKTELEMCRRKTKIQELNTSYASPDSSKKTTLNYKNSSKENTEDRSSFVEQRKIDFLQTITCLNVTLKDGHIYHCEMNDGLLTGHKFEVRYNSKDYEFRYKPIEVASTVKDSDELASSLAVPDYMLPKFLMMLLNKTYQATPEQSETIIVSESDDD